MMVSCARSDQAVTSVRLDPGSPSGPLVHGMYLAAGIQVALDLTAPGRWHAVSCTTPDAGDPLLAALVGGHFSRRRTSEPASGRPVPEAPASAAPWLRLATVEALDRWLQTPLEQCLLDAERAVTGGRAARTLPHGPARVAVAGEALRMARRSSRDLVVLFRRLGRSRPVPSGLRSAMENLVDGFSELVDDVAGPDHELTSVLEGWRRLSRRLGDTDRPIDAAPPMPDRSSAPAARKRDRVTQALSMIDPRQVRARVLALSADPASAEITAAAAADDSLLVRVPAFGPVVAPEVVARLLVRLVDRRSAEAKGHALLRASRTGTGCFEATVPLYGLDVADVRVDVADALSDHPPAPDDADAGLREARRAVVFLAEWRRLVGLAQLGVAATPARHLRKLAGRLQATRTVADAPLFLGGPSCAELEALADLGDDELLRRLRGDGPLAEGLRVLTAGPGALLVAELAASFLAPAA